MIDTHKRWPGQSDWQQFAFLSCMLLVTSCMAAKNTVSVARKQRRFNTISLRHTDAYHFMYICLYGDNLYSMHSRVREYLLYLCVLNRTCRRTCSASFPGSIPQLGARSQAPTLQLYTLSNKGRGVEPGNEATCIILHVHVCLLAM